MLNYSSDVSKAVSLHMHVNGLKQANLAALLGISQASVSAKLNGAIHWTMKDIDRLTEIGVKLPAPHVEVPA